MTNKKYFTQGLLSWNKKDNRRQMPWKGEKDPYKIWLSEIILQQTRVDQGLEYYNRFVSAFPTVEILAKAPQTKVFKLWEGLGYYTRCKNLIATAKFIVKECKGKFPGKYDDIIALKGIGPYTAAAISSFAFNLPYAVVDGNVFRVLSRYFGIFSAIDNEAGKKSFTKLANELLYIRQPGIYNQALMDFGAIVCKPKLPLCTDCYLKSKCVAYLNSYVDTLPVKEKSIINKNRWFYYFIISFNGKIYLQKRKGKDIWENLYEFVLAEKSSTQLNINRWAKIFLKELLSNKNFEIISVSKLHIQQLTHQTINGRFIRVAINKQATIPGFKAVSAAGLSKLPFPKLITGYINNNALF